MKIDLKNCDIFSTKICVDNAPLNDAKTFLLSISLCPFSFICQNGDGCVTIHKSWFHLCREGHTPFLRLDLFYHLKNDCRKKTPWNPFGQSWIRPYIPGTTSPYLPDGSILSFDMPRWHWLSPWLVSVRLWSSTLLQRLVKLQRKTPTKMPQMPTIKSNKLVLELQWFTCASQQNGMEWHISRMPWALVHGSSDRAMV